MLLLFFTHSLGEHHGRLLGQLNDSCKWRDIHLSLVQVARMRVYVWDIAAKTPVILNGTTLWPWNDTKSHQINVLQILL